MRAKLAGGGVYIYNERARAARIIDRRARIIIILYHIVMYSSVYLITYNIVRVCVCGEVVTLTPAGLVNQKRNKKIIIIIIIMYTKYIIIKIIMNKKKKNTVVRKTHCLCCVRSPHSSPRGAADAYSRARYCSSVF